jgi:hypothetical protein
MEFLQTMSFWPVIELVLMIVGSVVTLASAIIAITPSKKDDEMLDGLKSKFGAVLSYIEKFSLIERKKKAE